ncbi:uncharacterized protein LOC124122267 [Haliotis rufescens]|uniref:uncharacterized protein LOC124122267 n=1 Tax=Haliotis rufescens TaxID=6454 RepID=UPI00201F16AF|nr:uncharacterized protein LOC124122267 [Haliotis rufescens]
MKAQVVFCVFAQLMLIAVVAAEYAGRCGSSGFFGTGSYCSEGCCGGECCTEAPLETYENTLGIIIGCSVGGTILLLILATVVACIRTYQRRSNAVTVPAQPDFRVATVASTTSANAEQYRTCETQSLSPDPHDYSPSCVIKPT